MKFETSASEQVSSGSRVSVHKGGTQASEQTRIAMNNFQNPACLFGLSPIIDVDELYVLARRVLLDALDVLGAHRSAMVLVGAQGVYNSLSAILHHHSSSSVMLRNRRTRVVSSKYWK